MITIVFNDLQDDMKLDSDNHTVTSDGAFLRIKRALRMPADNAYYYRTWKLIPASRIKEVMFD